MNNTGKKIKIMLQTILLTQNKNHVQTMQDLKSIFLPSLRPKQN